MGRNSMFSGDLGFVHEELQFGDDDYSGKILLKNNAGTLEVKAIDGAGDGNLKVEGTTTLTGAATMTGDITSSTGDITATAGAVVAGTTVTGGTGVVATTGDVAATAGAVTAGTSVSATTTVTGGTGVTATTGNVTASAGNLVATVGDVSAVNGTLTGDLTLSGRQINTRYNLREDFLRTATADLNGTVYTGVGGAVTNQQLVLTSDGAGTADTFYCHAAKLDDTIDLATHEPYVRAKLQLSDVTTGNLCVFSVGIVDTTGDYFRIRFTQSSDTFFTVEAADGTLTATDASAVTPVAATDYVFELGYNATDGFYASIDGTAITLTNLATLDHTQFTAASVIISSNDATGGVLTTTVDKFEFDMIDVW